MAANTPDSSDPLAETLARLAAFLPRLSGGLTVDGPLGRIRVEALHDTVVVNLTQVPELAKVRALFARPAGPEKAAPSPGESAEKGSKREAVARAREKTRMFSSSLDAAGLSVEVRVADAPLVVVGRKADPGIVTRALRLGKVDLSGKVAFKLARELFS